MSLPYVPVHYEMTMLGNVRFYFSAQETAEHRELIQRTGMNAFYYVIDVLSFTPMRQVHVCCYSSSDDAHLALGRSVSSTMAMAPYSDSDRGLVIIHSPSLDPMNGDETRMHRILAHEFVHLFVAERAGSTKLLGDDNRNMLVSSWLNEGLAEVVGLRSIVAVARLSAMVESFCTSEQFHAFGTLSHWLDDLDDVSRALAFKHVTAAVEMLCRRYGIRSVFDQLQRIEGFFDPHDCCSPSRLAELGK